MAASEKRVLEYRKQQKALTKEKEVRLVWGQSAMRWIRSRGEDSEGGVKRVFKGRMIREAGSRGGEKEAMGYQPRFSHVSSLCTTHSVLRTTNFGVDDFLLIEFLGFE